MVYIHALNALAQTGDISDCLHRTAAHTYASRNPFLLASASRSSAASSEEGVLLVLLQEDGEEFAPTAADWMARGCWGGCLVAM